MPASRFVSAIAAAALVSACGSPQGGETPTAPVTSPSSAITTPDRTHSATPTGSRSTQKSPTAPSSSTGTRVVTDPVSLGPLPLGNALEIPNTTWIVSAEMVDDAIQGSVLGADWTTGQRWSRSLESLTTGAADALGPLRLQSTSAGPAVVYRGDFSSNSLSARLEKPVVVLLDTETGRTKSVCAVDVNVAGRYADDGLIGGSDGGLFFEFPQEASPNGNVTRIEPTTCATIWSQPIQTSGIRLRGNLISASNYLGGAFTVYDAATGTVKWSVPTDQDRRSFLRAQVGSTMILEQSTTNEKYQNFRQMVFKDSVSGADVTGPVELPPNNPATLTDPISGIVYSLTSDHALTAYGPVGPQIIWQQADLDPSVTLKGVCGNRLWARNSNIDSDFLINGTNGAVVASSAGTAAPRPTGTAITSPGSSSASAPASKSTANSPSRSAGDQPAPWAAPTACLDENTGGLTTVTRPEITSIAYPLAPLQ